MTRLQNLLTWLKKALKIQGYNQAPRISFEEIHSTVITAILNSDQKGDDTTSDDQSFIYEDQSRTNIGL